MKESFFQGVKVIGFDADDTLWVNETFFRDAEKEFCQMLSDFETENKIMQELFRIEMQNLEIYGYGIKSFTLSMIECALFVSNQKLSPVIQNKILGLGKDMLNKPVELLEGVVETLESVHSQYRILLLTKGDLLDQQRKLEKSGLSHYFHHVEVLSHKKAKDYLDLLTHLNIDPQEFLMIGNSIQSDILPLYEIGARAVHIPFHTTWIHEQPTAPIEQEFPVFSQMKDLLNFL